LLIYVCDAATLRFLADERPRLLCECTPVFLCTPVGLDAGDGTVFVRFVKDFGLVHLEASIAHLEVRVILCIGFCGPVGTGVGVAAVFLASDGGENLLDKLLVFFASLFRFLGVRLPFLLGRLGFLFA